MFWRSITLIRTQIISFSDRIGRRHANRTRENVEEANASDLVRRRRTIDCEIEETTSNTEQKYDFDRWLTDLIDNGVSGVDVVDLREQ